MSTEQPNPHSAAAPTGSDAVELRALSPRTVAALIRALDSRLVEIASDPGASQLTLCYSFEVAGNVQTFRISPPSTTLNSISDLYPQAAIHEQALRQQFGLTFLPADVVPAQPPLLPDSVLGRIYDVTLPCVDPPAFAEPGGILVQVQPSAEVSGVSQLSMSGQWGRPEVGSPVQTNARTVDHKLLDLLIGPALVLELEVAAVISIAALTHSELPPGTRRLLLKARRSAGQRMPEHLPARVGIDPSAAQWLVEQGIELIGLDYHSLAAVHSHPAILHQTLLAAQIVVLEGLNLKSVPAGNYHLVCLPLKVPDAGCPVRALLAGTALQTG
jgi:arylformamidase